MDTLKEIVSWTSANWYGVLIIGSMGLALAEMIVRLTPTKADDGAVQRVAKLYDKIFVLLKVPNIKKKDGTLIVPDGKHPKK